MLSGGEGGGKGKESVANAGYTAIRMMTFSDVVCCYNQYKTSDCILLGLEIFDQQGFQC